MTLSPCPCAAASYIPQVSQGLRQLLSLQPALQVCAGDRVAGQKQGLSAAQLEAMWDSFARTALAPVRQALGLQFVDTADFPFHDSVLKNDVFWLVWDASSSSIPPAQPGRGQPGTRPARRGQLDLIQLGALGSGPRQPPWRSINR